MKNMVKQHKNGSLNGICSVCSAHPIVIEAALRFDLHNNKLVLIESTSNQCNQYGGYTGMTPADFRSFVENIADQVQFPRERIIFGGDHLGPNCWQHESSKEAMKKSKILIQEYVAAGFTKIHLDASMSCVDDITPLPPIEVARRAAILCLVAEETASPEQRQRLSYIIGTEVPVPGGETDDMDSLHVTTKEDAKSTIDLHIQAFEELGISHAMDRVIGIVVQPGVEFDHSNVARYQRQAAAELSQFIESTPMIYEAHSTDYQTKESLKEMVEDHFAILKVGPGLTFALREALFSLADIESNLIKSEQQSRLKRVIDEVMLDLPEYWEKYYSTLHSDALLNIHFSLSDRIRYYWPNERISNAVKKMIDNLNNTKIPFGLLSQYFPDQAKKIANGTVFSKSEELVIDKIQQVLADYSYACGAT